MEGFIKIGNIRGEKGDTGTGLTVKDFYSTLEELQEAVPNPSVGDAYGVGEDGAYEIYIYSASQKWVNSGAFQPDINEQAPTYEEATTLETLTSGEKVSLAFGKIKKAIKELISHLADTTKHITSTERTKWNNKAPGDKGLGGVCASRQHIPFIDVMHDGCGFFQVACDEDSPNSVSGWMDLLQLVRNQNDGAENGAQLAFNDYESIPYMWLRTLIRGKGTDWVEMLHTGNISNFASFIKVNTYTGDGNPSKFINLGFTPSAVFVLRRNGDISLSVGEKCIAYHYGGLALKNSPCYALIDGVQTPIIQVEENGFNVYRLDHNPTSEGGVRILSNNSETFYYFAIK